MTGEDGNCKKCKRVREPELSDNPLELVSTVTQFNDIHEFMSDEEVDRAMHLVVKLLMEKGSIPAAQAPKLIVELQALATKFAVLATYYATIGKGGTDENHKKNVYFTLKDSLSKLTDALKYAAKVDG
jgi:hypothetical protein